MHRMQGPGDSKYERFSLIAEQLADLAIELQLPILLLAQLNRSFAARPDKRPEAADLRDAGTIEECAVNLGLIWRPGRYPDLRDKMLKKLKSQHLTAGDIDLKMYEFDSMAQLVWEKARFEGPSVKDIGWMPDKGYFVNLKGDQASSFQEMF